MNKNIDLTTGSVYRGMLRFALPLFLSNLLTLMYNLADTVIVGRFLGNAALAGVGSTGTLMFLMNGLMIGFTTGTSVITSRAFGRRDDEGVRRSAAMSLILAVLMALTVTLILLFAMPAILRLMNTDREFYDEAYEYIMVISAGLILMTLYKLFESMLRAIGISKMSLIFAAVAFAANIALDLLFIAVFKMGTSGAALATILSFGLCAALCLWYIVKKAPALHLKREHFKLSGELIKSQLKMALPMSLQHSAKGVGFAIVQSSYNLLGTVPVAAYAVAGKLEHITTDAYTALGSTVATHCGTNAGAGKTARIKKGFKAALVIGIVYTVISGGLLLLFAKHLTPLFISQNVNEAKGYVATFMYCVAPFFALLCTLVILRYGIQGLGHSALAISAALIELACRTVMAFIGGRAKSFVITSLAFPVSWFATAAFVACVYLFYVRKKL